MVEFVDVVEFVLLSGLYWLFHLPWYLEIKVDIGVQTPKLDKFIDWIIQSQMVGGGCSARWNLIFIFFSDNS